MTRTAAREGLALGAMSDHALDVSQHLAALLDRMVAQGWGVDGYARAELRVIAANLRSTSIRAARACGDSGACA